MEQVGHLKTLNIEKLNGLEVLVDGLELVGKVYMEGIILEVSLLPLFSAFFPSLPFFLSFDQSSFLFLDQSSFLSI